MPALPAGNEPDTAHTPPLHGDPWAAQIDAMETVVHWLRASAPYLEALARALIDALRAGGRLYIFGNGGSASQASHFAAELVGRFRRNRRPLPAQALPADGSLLTCIANDFAFTDLFARQLVAFGRPGDVAIGLTTSGRSANVLLGLDAARARGLVTVGFCGQDDTALRPLCDWVVTVPSRETARVQEGHLAVIHLLCHSIDAAFA
ncbi:MAG TPA: SIS domain-containing protein [Limnochordales bacterium]